MLRFDDRGRRACLFTYCTVRAKGSINHVDGVAFLNGSVRTFRFASTTSYAFVGNDSGHDTLQFVLIYFSRPGPPPGIRG